MVGIFKMILKNLLTINKSKKRKYYSYFSILYQICHAGVLISHENIYKKATTLLKTYLQISKLSSGFISDPRRKEVIEHRLKRIKLNYRIAN